MDAATAQRIATAKISGIPIPPQGPAVDTAQESPAETQAEPEQPLVEAGGQPDGEPAQTQQDSDLEEIDFDGVKFSLQKDKVPSIKEALMRHADYTRKTQDVSERARVLGENEKMFQAQSQFHKDSIDDIAQIRALDQAIGQYKNVNWTTLGMEDLTRTRLQYDQLKEARQEAEKSLNTKWGEFNRKREEHFKSLEKAGRDEISRRIQGFDDKQASELKDYAKKSGYTDQEISMIFYRPLDIEMIWKARQFDNLQGTKGVINQRVNKAPPVAKPGASTQQKPEGEKALVSFYAEKNKAKKEQLGAQLLARKLRI